MNSRITGKQRVQRSWPSAPNEPVRTIAFFGHDSTESTVIKRVKAFQTHGSRVIGFMFKRAHRSPTSVPTWENIELGTTLDRHYLRRIPLLLVSVLKLLRHRQSLKQCQI